MAHRYVVGSQVFSLVQIGLGEVLELSECFSRVRRDPWLSLQTAVLYIYVLVFTCIWWEVLSCSVQGMVYMYRGQPGGLGLRQAAYHDIKHPTLKAGWSPCTKKWQKSSQFMSLFFLGLPWDQRLGMSERTGTPWLLVWSFKWKE